MDNITLDYTLKILNRRPYSVLEIERKLKRKNVSNMEIQKVITYLKDSGYLDDEKYAYKLLFDISEFHPCGYFLIFSKLRGRGIPWEIVEKVLKENFDCDEEKKVCQKFILKKKLGDLLARDCRKLFQKLKFKGFRNEVIQRVLSDHKISN